VKRRAVVESVCIINSIIEEIERGYSLFRLRDTIINFGDYLHERVGGGYENAEKICKESDLSITLGSSLTVPPACLLPMMSKQKIVCNLQKTEYDSESTVRYKNTARYELIIIQ
jgi:NAD-dependent SIR2 family protein deacetylase